MTGDTDESRIRSDLRLTRVVIRRLARALRRFARSDVGDKAIAMAVSLVALLLVISGFNVVNSYVGRDFMTAIEHRDTPEFLRQAVRYLLVFAASTVAAVVYRFFEERLGLTWREWTTRELVQGYLREEAYYRLHVEQRQGLANPDQRIADDVRLFTTNSLSLLLMLLNGTITVVAFAGVLWTISPRLFFVGVGYAAVGSFVTIMLGRRLVWLNYAQSDREADFRTDLLHVREHAESVALMRREHRLQARMLRHLDALIANTKRIIAVNRNLGFFTTGYNYMIQMIPALVVAPLFIRGEVEFGVITQAAMAFSFLVGAFSLIVTQFQSISSYAAVAARLNALVDALEHKPAAAPRTIEIVRAPDRITYESLTLRSPRDGRLLIRDLDLSIEPGTRLLVRAADDTAKVALLRATAGLWETGEGRIAHPGPENLLFLPERPYLPPGTLREVLVRLERDQAVSDAQIVDALREMNLEKIVVRTGGLAVERSWRDILSLDEQQLLAFTRLLIAVPRFVYLDRVGTALNPAQVEQVLHALQRRGIGYVSIGYAGDRLDAYDAALEIAVGGAWELKAIDGGRIVEAAATS